MPKTKVAKSDKKHNIKEDLRMGLRIQHNIAALNAHRNLMTSDAGLSKSLERLSSGYRINSAKDDAAGLAISQTFRADIASVKVAQRNISEANALLQTAEGAMDTIANILTRMKELATQAASANVGGDVTKVSAEYNALVSEIDRIADSTKYAGVALVNGSFNAGNTTDEWDSIANIYDVTATNAATGAYTCTAVGAALTLTKDGVSETQTLTDGGGTAGSVNFSTLGVSFSYTGAMVATTAAAALAAADITVDAGTTAAFQVGYEETTQSQLGVSLGDANTAILGVANDDISTSALAYAALSTIDSAIATLAGSRGDIGAYQNRLSYASSNLSITLENFTAAESVIRDVDMAAEMTTFTKNQILLQAGTAMLAQANMAPQMVLSLFG
jgi:flagellin